MSEQVKVAMSDKFMLAFSQLPKAQQRKTMEFISKFRQDPRSNALNYERIRDAADKGYRSVRIDQTYRGIILAPEQGNVFLLLWVDKHDDAYAWARSHKCEVHPNTGSLQIYEASLEADSEVGNIEVAIEKSSAYSDIPEVTEPLFHLTDEQFSSLGVPEKMLPLVKTITTESQLELLERRLPIEAYDPLYLMAAGTPWSEIEADYLTPKSSVNTDDIEAALARPSSQREFWVVDNEMELLQMLNAPLERWRVFLHPTQRRLVERKWNGPVRVLGGAGTGKTVVAMHRARWLVRNVIKDGEKLLFTTFTANLATDIEESLKKICSPEEMKKIDVKNIDRWVSEFLRSEKYSHTIVYEGSSDQYKAIWRGALSVTPTLGLPDSFYREEWERVILPQRVHTKAEYFKASRIGRGVALNRKQRDAIWPVFEELRAEMHHAGLKTFEDATLDAGDILRTKTIHSRYRCVLVDEAQDMGPQAMTLLRTLVAEQQDDMFIVGDGHQRIYRRKSSMSQCGIHIIGRGRKLRINYRTTEETRRFASAVLQGIAVDDLDGGEDTGNDYRSLIHGTPPEISGFFDVTQEVNWIVDRINDLIKTGVETRNICIVARVNSILTKVSEIISKAGIETVVLSRNVDNRNVTGVRIATMHRVKGLEFHFVFLAGVNNGIIPLTKAIGSSDDPVELRQYDLSERALLHVAATRAIKGLFVSYHGTASPYLGAG